VVPARSNTAEHQDERLAWMLGSLPRGMRVQDAQRPETAARGLSQPAALSQHSAAWPWGHAMSLVGSGLYVLRSKYPL